MDFSDFSSISGAQWLFFTLVCAVLILFLVLLIILWQREKRIRKKLEIFFDGKDAKNLETILLEQKESMKVFDKEIQELFGISNRIYKLALQSLHKTEVIRFNPFKEVGSNQSFCVALLDGKNSGVVISSLHTREGTRVYAKPVVQGLEAGHPFTDEERQAIETASNRDSGVDTV